MISIKTYICAVGFSFLITSPFPVAAQDMYNNQPVFSSAWPSPTPVLTAPETSPETPKAVDQVSEASATMPSQGQLNLVQKDNQIAPNVSFVNGQPPIDPEISDAGPAQWQTGFIRKLVGGDGTLDIVSGSQGFPASIAEMLPLDQAVSMALQNNPQIKAAIASVESKKWDKFGAYAQYFPIVQLDLAKGRERSRPASYNDELGNRVADNWHDRHDRVVTVRQPIFDLGILSDILIGEDREDMSYLERKDVQDTIAAATVTSYLRLIQAKISIGLAEEYQTYLDNLASTMRSRVEGGGASLADLDRIVARSTQAENARVEAESEFQSALLELQRLTGAVPLQVKVPDVMAPSVPDDIEAALGAAFDQNAGYRASLMRADIAEGDRNKAYSGLAPRIYAQYTSGYTYNAGGSANGNPVDGVYPTQRTNAAMVVAQWTINGGVPVAGGLSAQARMKQASMDSLDIRQKLDQGLRVGYSALQTSRDRLRVLQKAVQANESVIAGFEEQYKNGTRSAFELLDAYEQLYNARLNLMRVIFAHSQASYQVHLQMGDIVPSIVKNTDG